MIKVFLAITLSHGRLLYSRDSQADETQTLTQKCHGLLGA